MMGNIVARSAKLMMLLQIVRASRGLESSSARAACTHLGSQMSSGHAVQGARLSADRRAPNSSTAAISASISPTSVR
jgi:hypothetical protein